MSAMTASVAPSASAPESPMKICGGVHVEPQEAQQGADDERAQDGEVGLGRRGVSAAMTM